MIFKGWRVQFPQKDLASKLKFLKRFSFLAKLFKRYIEITLHYAPSDKLYLAGSEVRYCLICASRGEGNELPLQIDWKCTCPKCGTIHVFKFDLEEKEDE